MTEEHVVIDTFLMYRLIASQFPQWKELSIDPVATFLESTDFNCTRFNPIDILIWE